jgi:hypothetical protein
MSPETSVNFIGPHGLSVQNMLLYIATAAGTPYPTNVSFLMYGICVSLFIFDAVRITEYRASNGRAISD